MGFKKWTQNWTPSHFLGFSVLMVMLLGAMIVSNHQPPKPLSPRQPAQVPPCDPMSPTPCGEVNENTSHGGGENIDKQTPSFFQERIDE
jgi:hypothetical protein